MTHITLDLLSAHLDGALQAASSDAVRHHLEWCEQCRAEGVRIASTNDALAALLTHDPDDRFVEALGSFLEDRIEAKDAADSLPPELDRAIADEIARLEARRWTAVAEAVPRALLGPARGAEPPEGTAPGAARRAPREPRPLPAPRDSGATYVLSASEVRAVGPAEPAPPARLSGTRPARGRAGRLIGAALVALVPLSAGLYVAMRGSRSWPDPAHVSHWFRGGVRAGTGAAPAGVRAGYPGPAVADSSSKPGTVSDSGAAGVGAAATPAKDSAAMPDPGARATVVRGVPETTVTSSPAPATTRRSSMAVPSPEPRPGAASPAATRRPPAPSPAPPSRAASPPASRSAPARSQAPAPAAPPGAATEWGILCGRVSDERGAPVVRARVLLADLEVGALTDHRGRFCISVPVGARTVSVVALGFATQRRTVTVKRTTPELALTLRAAVEP